MNSFDSTRLTKAVPETELGLLQKTKQNKKTIVSQQISVLGGRLKAHSRKHLRNRMKISHPTIQLWILSGTSWTWLQLGRMRQRVNTWKWKATSAGVSEGTMMGDERGQALPQWGNMIQARKTLTRFMAPFPGTPSPLWTNYVCTAQISRRNLDFIWYVLF